MTSEDDARARLAEAMEDRRVDLRMSWDEVAQAATISVAHLRRIRKGTATITPIVARGLEDALQWTTGSIRRLEAGDEPNFIHSASADLHGESSLAVSEDDVAASEFEYDWFQVLPPGKRSTADGYPVPPKPKDLDMPPGYDPTSFPLREVHIMLTPDTTIEQRAKLILELRGLRQVGRNAMASLLESNGRD